MRAEDIDKIAKVCHEVNRAYCLAIGDDSQLPWDSAPAWQRTAAFSGVVFHLDNRNALPAASHETWLTEKRDAGWKYGPYKNANCPSRSEPKTICSRPLSITFVTCFSDGRSCVVPIRASST